MDRYSFLVSRARIAFAVGMLITAAVAASATAEGFRIETKIFVGKDKEPTSTTTTLFMNGVVYDFLSSPEQIAVFSQPRGNKPGRFILLDPERGVRTEFSTEKLNGAMDNLTKWASQQKNSFLKFSSNPKFDESYDKASGKIVLTSYEENYRIDTVAPERPETLGEYREFLDWYTKLNTLLEAGPPPGPRLQVNAALAKHKVIPTRVELTHRETTSRFGPSMTSPGGCRRPIGRGSMMRMRRWPRIRTWRMKSLSTGCGRLRRRLPMRRSPRWMRRSSGRRIVDSHDSLVTSGLCLLERLLACRTVKPMISSPS